MTIQQAIIKYKNVEIDLLLSAVLKKSREFVFLNPDISLSANQLIKLSALVKRRMSGEPMAYILGYKDFCGLNFKVNKNVLIPRPETEWIVDAAISSLSRNLLIDRSLHSDALGRDGNKKISILDVGTGSGCIAVSIAKQVQGSGFEVQVSASDISKKALAIAKQNAKMHKAKIKFILSDLFKNVTGKFDIIVANLPYVPIRMFNKYISGSSGPHDPFTGLKFEPISALTDGTRSFQIYRRFFEQVGGHIYKNSIVFLEIDPSSRKFIAEYQKKYLPSSEIKFYKDHNGLWRYAEITPKPS